MTSKQLWTWVILFNIFNLLDAVLTAFGVTKAGAIELNPIVRYILSFGLIPFFIIKLNIGALASLYFFKVKRKRLIKWLTVILGGVVLWNIGMLLTKFFIG